MKDIWIDAEAVVAWRYEDDFSGTDPFLIQVWFIGCQQPSTFYFKTEDSRDRISNAFLPSKPPF